MTTERQLLERALTAIDDVSPSELSAQQRQILLDLRSYLRRPWKDELYARYDEDGNSTDDELKVASLLYVRKSTGV